MAILPIYTYGAPALRKKAHPVKSVGDDILTLVMDMFQTMRSAGGIGLAATQVGSLNRVIVIDISDCEGYKEVKPIAMINPVLVESVGRWTVEEGCLSIPEVRDEVERAGRIRVRYRDTSDRETEIEAEGLLGRVILHEMDHLDGILFLDHLTPERKKAHRDQLKQIQRGEMDVAYPVVTAADVAV